MSAILLALTRLFFWVAKAVGILPFSYNIKRKIATTSKLWRCYTTVILITIVVLTPPVITTIYSRMSFLRQQPLLAFLGYHRYVALHLCVIFTIFTQLLKDQSVIYCCNEALRIYNSLCSLSTLSSDCVKLTDDKSIILQLLTKVITLWPITQMTLFYMYIDRALGNMNFLFALLSVYYCQLMLIMTVNIFFGATLILTGFTWHVNRRLKRTFKEIQTLKLQPGRENSLKMQKYCDLAETLDTMMELYKSIVSLRKIVNRQFEVQIVCFLLYVAIECVVQCYILYFVWTKMKHASRIGSLLSCCYIVAWLLDLTLVIGAAGRLSQAFMETKWTIRTLEEVGRVDVRLERMIEQLSFYVQNEKVEFAACGLFVVDNRCLFMMCRLLLAFLLILIQFDKIFKNKK